MTFASQTPEALISRSDSKDPATTCKGLTSNGRPCRRSIVASIRKGETRRPGINVRLSPNDNNYAAISYCWQHRDQAQTVTDNKSQSQPPPASHGSHDRRGSIDTLVSRLGLLEVDTNTVTIGAPLRPGRELKSLHHPNLSSIPGMNALVGQRSPRSSATSKKKTPSPSFWQSLCCAGSSHNEDYLEVVKHKSRIQNARVSETKESPRLSTHQQSESRRSHLPVKRSQASGPELAGAFPTTSIITSTGNLYSLLPPTLSPQTTASIFAELAKPISSSDGAGYIYIFWLTPLASFIPSSDLTSSLLSSANANINVTSRQAETLKSFTNHPDDRKSAVGAPPKGKLLLKIGRASNVHRRLTQWSRQCGYTLSLIRWYPYIPSASSCTTNHSPKSAWHPISSTPKTRSAPTLPANLSRNPSTAPSTSQKSSPSVSNSTTPLQSSIATIPLIRPAPQTSPQKSRATLPTNPARSSSTPMLTSTRQHQHPRSQAHHASASTSSVLLPGQSPHLPPLQTRASTGTVPTTPRGPAADPCTPPATPPQLPHAHRTERLIHLELADRRAKLGPCAACGKEHREWFEVEASRAGVRAVDEVVRRWVEWGMREGTERVK